MQQKIVTIKNPSGLHARPGNDFVKLAKTFESSITIVKGDKEFNGKSLLKLMSAGITKDDQLTIVCEGADEEVAVNAMAEYIEKLED